MFLDFAFGFVVGCVIVWWEGWCIQGLFGFIVYCCCAQDQGNGIP
jgi:hypothetical protein